MSEERKSRDPGPAPTTDERDDADDGVAAPRPGVYQRSISESIGAPKDNVARTVGLERSTHESVGAPRNAASESRDSTSQDPQADLQPIAGSGTATVTIPPATGAGRAAVPAIGGSGTATVTNPPAVSVKAVVAFY